MSDVATVTPAAEATAADQKAPSEIRIGPEAWPQAIAAAHGPQLVVGGPGTGKTEFLVRRAVHLVDGGVCPPDNLLCLTFSRRGAFDLSDRIHDGLGRTVHGIDTSTYHSFAMRLLEMHGPRAGWPETPTVLSGPEQQRFVSRLLHQEDPGRWSPAFRSLLESRTFAGEATDFLLRCREQLITPHRLAELATTHHEWRGLPEFFATYDAALRSASRLDYGTLLSEAVALLEVSEVREAAEEQYRFILVDEYQDTTVAQAHLLQGLTASLRNVTAAADPYQSIYSFRGADLGTVARFPREFADADGTPAQRIVLTTSHRVPEAILDAAVRVTQGELSGAAGKVVPAPGSASVETYRFQQQTEEAEWIASEVQRLQFEQSVPFGRMAVFVRTRRRFITDLSRALDRRNIPHDRPDARLADQSAVRFIHDCVLAVTEAEGPVVNDAAVRRILLGPLFRVPLGRFLELERLRVGSDATWPTLIESRLPELRPLALLLADPSWATEIPAVEGLWRLWEELPQTASLVATDHVAAWTSYAQILDRWRDREPGGTLAEHRRLAEDEEFEASPLFSYRVPNEDRITITTLHQSKGLEFDVVFIADAVEGVFPDLRARDSLLATRRLSPHQPSDMSGYLSFRLQEERRLAYTAMTRATRRVVWTATASGFDEGGGIPSRFLTLVTGRDAAQRPRGGTTPVTPLEIEAALRRTLENPADHAVERLAALEVLGAAPVPLRDPDRFFGIRRRGPDDGVLVGELSLSPSQADLYETCPRRYALERRLGVGDEDSIYAAFGSLVHDVLEAAEDNAQAAGVRRSTLDEALRALDDQFEPDLFGGEPFATAWRARAGEALRNLYAHWPGGGPPLVLEHPLEMMVDGVRWRGRADRIEDRNQGAVVVDYKTAKTPMPVDTAKQSIQLGFYVLAGRQDPRIEEHGPVTAAEFWYPLAARSASIAVREFDLDRLADIQDRMRAVAVGIRDEKWPPRPGSHCSHCRVRTSCPARPEGREAFSR